jgi:hypothetical protein
MKKIFFALCAISAVALATPAIAADLNGVTITQPVSGTPDSAQIFGITNATLSTTQFGTEPSNGGAANVTFTGNTGFTIDNGFAQLITGSAGLTSLTINPNALFTDMKLAFSLTGQGNFDSPVTVFYLLSNGTTGTLAGAVNGTGNNGNFEIGITGGLFDSITIASTGDHGFGAIKQVSFEPVAGAVPEPATWAMMLLGFGAIGVSMRRRKPVLAQVA